MNDTPRTDAEVFLLFTTGDDEGVTAKFARKLERENAALREALEFAAKAHDYEAATFELASRLYDVSCVARAALARKEAQP